MKRLITLRVNGIDEALSVEPGWTLSRVLREELNLVGTKEGCGGGHCGACTVLIDSKPVMSCLYLAIKARGKDILTIEGLKGENGALHPLQEAFVERFAVQCGYCIPGMIMTAKALLDDNPSPTEEEIREGLNGNVCRCTGYVKIIEAILSCAEERNVKSPSKEI
ncbi:MAG: (2Fe-2S)-binding protein [Deltaproteobacteria bacterium]|nr:(2Fe-2S)-binding protein [Deltaproteobacteria bacterium]